MSAALRSLDPCTTSRARSATIRATMMTVVACFLTLLVGNRGWCQGSSGDSLAALGEVSRAQAIAAATATSGRISLAAADTAVASAQLTTASALPNPTLSASYSKATPNYHTTAELPLDLPWFRGARVGSARAVREAARLRYTFERAGAALDADTAYTRALAARSRLALSRRNADGADSLRRMAVLRRDAGDASEMDVELATITAGQQANVVAADSLELMARLLDLQAAMGVQQASTTLVLTDSLSDPPPDPPSPSATPVLITAAERSLAAARLGVTFQRRSLLQPSLMVGFETGDPSGAEPGLLPTVGIALPIPLFDFNRGGRAQAAAERLRAEASLSVARRESAVQIAEARRRREIALTKLARDRTLIRSAERLAAMALVAYRDGASSLPNVLEAQRNAREVLGQYVDDLAAAWIATSELRLLTLGGVTP
jgi:cobalt-zinc-cadmium efflux system outer membrane protein